ncbi:unnamed protein product [Ixodes pacificus]
MLPHIQSEREIPPCLLFQYSTNTQFITRYTFHPELGFLTSSCLHISSSACFLSHKNQQTFRVKETNSGAVPLQSLLIAHQCKEPKLEACDSVKWQRLAWQSGEA